MGLKYSIFIVKMKSEDLLKKLVDSGLRDETELMKRDIEFDRQLSDEFDKLMKNKEMATTDKIKKLMTTMGEGAKDKDLREYQMRENEQKVGHVSIWWTTLKEDPQFVFGFYTSIRQIRVEFQQLMSILLLKAKVNEFVFVDYSSISNDGDIILIEEKDLTHFKYIDEEKENFEKYAKRIQKEINYPIWTIHDFLLDADKIDWEHDATYDITKKVVQ
jgi:hypothetical protein